MKKESEYFHEAKIDASKNQLSQKEILEGNALFLKFMGFDSSKSEKWILECALYDKSYDELMKVAQKIDTFSDENSSWINEKKFNYKHMMFHQIIDFNYFYRRTVKFVKNYYEWLEE